MSDQDERLDEIADLLRQVRWLKDDLENCGATTMFPCETCDAEDRKHYPDSSCGGCLDLIYGEDVWHPYFTLGKRNDVDMDIDPIAHEGRIAKWRKGAEAAGWDFTA